MIQYTWEQLPYVEVLESVHRTAEAGSSIRTFLHGSKLTRLEVLRSGCKTADLGSSTVGFQWSQAVVHRTADLGSSTVTLGWLHPPQNWKCYKTASLGSSTVTFVSCLYNCRPQQFYGRFSVMRNIWLENCRPWKFYGHFSVMIKTGHRTSSLSSFTVTVKELQTLEVLRSLFSDDKMWP